MDDASKQYETPELVEHGDLRKLTEAVSNFGLEDGGQKGQPGFGGTGAGFSEV